MVSKSNDRAAKKVQAKYLVIGAIALILIFGIIIALVASQRPQVSNSTSTVTVPKSNENQPSFKNDVLTLKDITIKITDTKIVQPQEEGNEFGSNPAFIFYFEVTNISGDDVLVDNSFMNNFSAVQDNNPNSVGYLEWAHGQTSSTGNDTVKKGGTVASRVGFALTDTTTPVILTATNGTFGDVLGTKTIKLQN